MTKPAFVAFSYDHGQDGKPVPKIFIRALLFSTGKRGHVVENMFVILHTENEKHTFNIWEYGDEKLSRGSGLYVGEAGVASNHHFTSSSKDRIDYSQGKYSIEMFATLLGNDLPTSLRLIEVTVDNAASVFSNEPEESIWFDWHPNEGQYQAHLETKRPPRPSS